MHALHVLIESNIFIAWAILILAFAVLAKCADLFVTASVGVGYKLHVPKLVIGIVLVSLATTAPELAVSLMSALEGKPEMALGNAVGSVICDDGLALALAAAISSTPVLIIPAVFKTAAVFLIVIDLLAFAFILPDNTLSRWEGVVLVAMFVAYIWFLFRQHKRGVMRADADAELDPGAAQKPLALMIVLFAVSLAGIILSSEFVISSATAIAHYFSVPEAIIALTLVALGTSIPEVATCVAAARKNEGAIAVGNILGADILNICWVAGASAIANDLTLSRKQVLFMFPSMFIIVGAMLIMLRKGYRLTRMQGVVLFGLYILYLASFFILFPPD